MKQNELIHLVESEAARSRAFLTIPSVPTKVLQALRKQLVADGYRVEWLDESRVLETFNDIAEECSRRFGIANVDGNLNALNDLLAGLPEVKRGYVLVLAHPSDLATQDTTAINDFRMVCEAVNEVWLNRTPMNLKLVVAGQANA